MAEDLEKEELQEEEYEEGSEAEDEELEDESGEIEAEEEPDEEGSEEDPEIPIVYEDEGKTIEKNVRYSELANMVKDYESLRQNIEQYNNYIRSVTPIVQTIQNSQLLQSILYYKAQGYSEEQIKEGLIKLWQQNPPQQTEEYESYEEELKAKLLKEIENRLKPIEAQTNTILLEKQVSEITQHNNRILSEVMKEEGIEQFSQKQLEKMGSLLAEMFPNTDFRLLRLNKTIAKSLVKLVQETEPAPAKKVAKGIKLPKIVQAKGIRNIPDKDLRGKEKPVTSLEERIKLKKELFK